MNTKKILIIIGVVIISLFVLNELRFVVWGAYGVPKQPSRPNCGETRYKYNVEINSKQEFLNLIESWKNVTSSQVGQEAFYVIQWFKHGQYNLNDVSIREPISLLFREKIYSVSIKDINEPCDIDLEISESGLVAVRGCCGI
ncbi:hypothetical protein HYX02_01890 [Candidatus Woesearchaeota archaeon]|nr:hypothetical protein [Candidatus Woesearchaeota archaeon]